MIIFLNDDKNLYSPEKDDYIKSLEYAKTLPNSINNKLVIHCFWRVPRNFGRKQLAVLKSIIVNHIDIIETVEINLWSNVDLSDNVYFTEVSKFVKLKKWDLYEEIKNTILEDCEFMTSQHIYDELCYLEGDLFRLLILNKYGGFYIDMDVLVLRSLLPLNDYEFLYQWSTSGFNNSGLEINGAVMRLDKNSSLSIEFLEILKRTTPHKNGFCWGYHLYPEVKKNTILALPCVWFDPGWGFDDSKNDSFTKYDNINFFEGSFTWHWHNRWDEEIEMGSRFQIIEEKHDKIFREFFK